MKWFHNCLQYNRYGSNPSVHSTGFLDFNGLACTKAGVSPLQGESGGFNSLRVHNSYRLIFEANPSEGRRCARKFRYEILIGANYKECKA